MKLTKTSRNYIIIAIIIVALIALDMLSKHFTTNVHQTIIPGVLSFYYTLNTGAGWSLFADKTLFLTIFSAIMVVGLIILIIFVKPKNTLYGVSIGLILAGAIGNLIDRIFLGAVRDFISLDFIKFPIFNVADMCLTFGAILIAIFLIFFAGRKEKNGKDNSKE